ncbi:hypothetical protein HD806DRAFT_527212 [Xylariaceae sp. AK1471]|nr:hypothetical protein HD806DRAFT_527212 [Xylariaceae sp. AK1471]
MVLQVSIGDSILLAQIAWRLAQTFTKGRQSAPAEFQEIENELYSLSAALTATQNERDNSRPSTDQASSGNDQHNVTQGIFEHIVRNCKHTLAHLEEIVKKYMIVSEHADPNKPKLERWSHSIRKNWRKVEWTTEKGDLNTLRSQIMVHTNSLNLLVSIATSSRAASIERSLDKKLVLLEELHLWYVDNLKDTKRRSSARSAGLGKTSEDTARSPSTSIISTFELAKKTMTSDELICPCTSLRSEWIESFLDGTLNLDSDSMFACSCIDRQAGVLSHQPTVQRYGLSHLIYPIRIANDDGSWLLHKTADRANNQLIDLYIKKIHPSYIRHLEDTFFNPLSRRRAQAILAQGAGNSLCYVSPDTQEEHILTSMGDLRISQQAVESITFRRGRTQHVRESVDDIQVLQYKARNPESSVGDTQADLVRLLEYAEILISFDADEARERGDVVSTILKSAEEFHEKIESMRKELFVRSLQYPRSNEKVMLNLQAARVECEAVYIDDAEITIVVDTDGKYRLIIASRNRCTIISQVLAEDFFTSPSTKPNYTGSTYLVQIEDTGERKVYHYKNGFRHLSLSTAQGEKSTPTKWMANG